MLPIDPMKIKAEGTDILVSSHVLTASLTGCFLLRTDPVRFTIIPVVPVVAQRAVHLLWF